MNESYGLGDCGDGDEKQGGGIGPSSNYHVTLGGPPYGGSRHLECRGVTKIPGQARCSQIKAAGAGSGPWI